MTAWRQAGLAALGLLAVSLLFEFTALDLHVQDYFFNAATGQWRVDANDPVGRLFFYNGPKIAVWIVAVTALVLALGPAAWRQRWQLQRRGLWLAVLVIAVVPALAGLGKNVTNTFCPSEIRRYGGDVPYVTLCEPFPANDRPERRGHCFPAGHASGGFALMGLLAIRSSARWRRGAILLGLAVGWWMGGYQMLKGAHYLSHTLTTMFLAWLVVAIGAELILKTRITNQESRIFHRS